MKMHFARICNCIAAFNCDSPNLTFVIVPKFSMFHWNKVDNLVKCIEFPVFVLINTFKTK